MRLCTFVGTNWEKWTRKARVITCAECKHEQECLNEEYSRHPKFEVEEMYPNCGHEEKVK